MDSKYDVIVIGGGIAGVSIAAELAAIGEKVVLLEAEKTLSFHTTGRSAATWIGTYGNEPVRQLTAASHGFFLAPQGGESLSKPLTTIWVGESGQGPTVEALYGDVVGLAPSVRLSMPDEVEGLVPVLRPGWLESALIDPTALEVDVAGLFQLYRRAFVGAGGVIRNASRVLSADHSGGRWAVHLGSGETFNGERVVNAAGAWVDQVGRAFGASPVGIQPRLRSMFMVGSPTPVDPSLPMVFSVNADNPFYFKADAGQYLCSPVDETLDVPRDARPDDLEIARAIDVINEATTLDIRSIKTPWGGLRNFVADGSPVVGFDPIAPGFFWFAGQGGFGIQMAPAAARLGAALLSGRDVPSDLRDTGFDPASLSPQRLLAGAARPV